MTIEPLSHTRQIAEFAAGLRPADVPSAVRDKAKLHIIDSLGCGIAGAGSTVARQVLRFLEIEHGEGPCPVIAGRRRFGAAAAGFANSTAMNALDFDDGFEVAGKGMGHPGSTIVASAFSAPFLGEVSGADFLAAVIAAYEVNNRLIRAMQPTIERHRQVYGVCQHQSVGAAIAFGKLAGLDAAALENAIGLAATLANVPSLHKYNWLRRPLISFKDFNGPATEAGIRAVQLHGCGLSGAKDVLDGEQGLWRMLGSDRFDAAALVDGLGSEWTLPHCAFKSYPVCRWMHTSLEALAAVIAEQHLTAEQIEAVTVHTAAGMARNFMQRDPASMIDAQFSLPYAVAALLLAGPPGAGWYDPATLQRHDIRAFADRVEAVVDPAIDEMMSGPLRRPSARVDVRANGRTFKSGLYEYPSGSAERPISEQAVAAKFMANASPVIGEPAARELQERLNRIETEIDVRSLLELTRSA